MFIRQLLIKCKNNDDYDDLCEEFRKFEKIDIISKVKICKCIIDDEYSYVDKDYDYAVFLFFDSYKYLENYCSHPIHINFVENILDKINIVIYDYVLKDRE